jgi:hypothetical protein
VLILCILAPSLLPDHAYAKKYAVNGWAAAAASIGAHRGGGAGSAGGAKRPERGIMNEMLADSTGREGEEPLREEAVNIAEDTSETIPVEANDADQAAISFDSGEDFDIGELGNVIYISPDNDFGETVTETYLKGGVCVISGKG